MEPSLFILCLLLISFKYTFECMKVSTRTSLPVFARMLRVVGDDVRLKIVCVLLVKRSLCVSEIASKLDESIAATSHHLRVLARAGVLESSPCGKERKYALASNEFVKDLKKYVCKYIRN